MQALDLQATDVFTGKVSYVNMSTHLYCVSCTLYVCTVRTSILYVHIHILYISLSWLVFQLSNILCVLTLCTCVVCTLCTVQSMYLCIGMCLYATHLLTVSLLSYVQTDPYIKLELGKTTISDSEGYIPNKLNPQFGK